MLRTWAGDLRFVLSVVWRAGRVTCLSYSALTVAAALLPVLTTWFTAALVSSVAGDRTNTTHVELVAAALGSVAMVSAAFAALNPYLVGRLGREARLGAMRRLYRALDRDVGVKRFETPADMDEFRVAHRAAGEMGTKTFAAVIGSMTAVITLSSLVGAVAKLDTVIGMSLAVACIPSIAASMASSQRTLRAVWSSAAPQRQQMLLSAILVQASTASELRSHQAQRFITDRMLLAQDRVNVIEDGAAKARVAYQLPLGVMTAIIYAAAVILAARQAIGQRQGVQTLTAVIVAVPAIQAAVGSFSRSIGSLYEALAKTRVLRRLTCADRESVPVLGPLPVASAEIGCDHATAHPPTLSGPSQTDERESAHDEIIRLEQVSFAYPGQAERCLDDVSMVVRRNSLTAIVGLNGSGKSTLLKLLGRLYQPDAGEIYWRGVPIGSIDIDRYRARLAFMMQDFGRYELVARENIGIGATQYMGDASAIRAAASMSGAEQVVAQLPRGYETMLSRVFLSADETERMGASGGVTLSGGQWQRVALARCMLRSNADLLVLDEPTAGLDPESESELLEEIFRVRADRSIVLVSHRLGGIIQADWIYVLDRGRMVEEGSHPDLMKAGGRYADLFEKQAMGYREQLNEVV